MAEITTFSDILDKMCDGKTMRDALKYIKERGGWESFKRAQDLKQLLEEIEESDDES